ncbi:hypothetical protein SAMN04487904_10846 [Actinopolyspora lacussalsi subsp. righensis]|uniref:Peptide chain release factor 1 (ERF1) n=1 Tax=Actinopolyspora righensis TaxID=995060 RepID=A0A1I7ASX1_9ACTN|nr:Vms1/Ankzf1 family peptidyl-tRNA hydrolase [Actinopolyspora righensis]SFT78020.1 hypothetical protein SAMN04487904_10846 [Actinopolyspora righensis]
MKLAYLQHLYQHRPPFVTVYLDTSADAEDARKAIELRWRSARERLSELGADDADLDAVERAVGSHSWRVGERGQVLVAAGGRVVFDDELPRPPTEFSDDELARVGPLPHLMPYLRLRSARIPHLLALVDHTGGDIHVIDAGRHSGGTTVQGDGSPVHKSHSAGEGDQKHHDNMVEEQWLRNAGQVAAEIDRQALLVGAEVIVLAGDVQQRKMVHDHLRKGLRDRVVDTEASHRDRNASEASLQREVSEAVDSARRERSESVVGEFERELGQRDRATDGWPDTVGALQRGQVAVLLREVSHSAEEPETLWIGTEPNQVATEERTLRDMGVSAPERVAADTAVLWSLVGTHADLVLVDPRRNSLTGGVASLLRYSDVGGGD